MLNPSDFKTCFGISSECEDGKHIIFIDSDHHSYMLFLKDLNKMQIEYGLSDIYVMRTENGFNAFCLDKMRFKEILNMLMKYNTFCKDHLRIGATRNYLVLRMSKDKKIINCIMPEIRNNKEMSLAHYLFFTNIMEYDLIQYYENQFDALLKFNVVAYYSKKHGIPEVKI